MNWNYIGIDISKSKFDADWLGQHWEVKQNEKEIEVFIEKVSKAVKKVNTAPVLLVYEASGGYECLLTKKLRERAIAYHRAHANKIRAFARSKGYLAKTDKMDARIIAEYGQRMEVLPDEIKLSENKEVIADLIKRRAQLMRDKQREQNRLDKYVGKEVISSQKAHIKWLEKEIKKVEELVKERSGSSEIKAEIELLTSVPGVGYLTALYLMVFLPELGQVSHKKLAALVGVAPYNNDSGHHQGKRFIQGGRHIIRCALYMAAIASITWNPELRAFYRNLIQRGKPARVAIVAMIRKMLCTLNSIVQRQSPWVEKEQFAH